MSSRSDPVPGGGSVFCLPSVHANNNEVGGDASGQNKAAQRYVGTGPLYDKFSVLQFRYFSQVLLSIFKLVTVMWPCSAEFLPTPCSLASALVSSLAPWRAAFCTAPVTVTVCPTC